jgi:hypothetical protein
MKKFDVVCHIGYDPLQEVGTTLEEIQMVLDENEVFKAILIPIGDGFIHRFKEQNRKLFKISSRYEKFLFFCTVNPRFGKQGVIELKACFADLNASGVAFDTSIQGLYIDSPMIYPYIEIARKFSKPVYFYTGIPIFALPLNLANLAHKFPDVKFIMGAMGVSDYWGDIIPSIRLSSNIYLETSINPNIPAVLKNFINEFGDDNVIFGSNYPYTDYKIECKKVERSGICTSSLEKIFFRNACNLFGVRL